MSTRNVERETDTTRGFRHSSPRQRGEALFEVRDSDSEAITAGVRAAAARSREWRATPLPDRADKLTRLAGLVEAAADPLARRMAIEIGKPITHGREEVRRAAANIRDVARRAREAVLEHAEEAGRVRRLPLGVIALISPWNNPVAIPLGKIAPALVYGNTVVWKPAPVANEIARALGRLIIEAGLPAGVVESVAGDQTVARALAGCDGIDAVTVTGGFEAGRSLEEICGRRFLPLQAELSGNNAAIVWEDADLEHAAREIAWGAFGFAGQRCTANRRVIVPRPLVSGFLGAVRTSAEQLHWGDPLDEQTDIGPVISHAKRGEHDALVAQAESDLGKEQVIRLFPQLMADERQAAGTYARPVIIRADDPGHPVVQEETMSPMLVVQPAADFDHALALCNGVRHGLAAALFSQRKELRSLFLAGARAGIVKFDTSTAGVDVRLPFGGCKASSVGPPEHGEADVQFHTRWQAVYGWDDR